MSPLRRTCLTLGAGLLLTSVLAAGTSSTAHTATRHDAPTAGNHVKAAEAAVAWQRIAIRTIYTEAGLAPPAGGLYLAFTSLAVYDAAREAQRHGRVAATVAVATAAHDVLHEYFTGSRQSLDHDLGAMLQTLPDGKKADAGAGIGAAAADAMIASRVGDGRGDPTRAYTRTAAPGVWPATGPGGMAMPWLGFVTPVVDVPFVALDGPDPMGSPAYAADYEEVRTYGAKTGSLRLQDETDIANFFVPNAVTVYRDALCRYLDTHPMGLLPLTRMFARIDGAVANSFIQTWRLKYDVGFWRPFQAIAGAATDGNEATSPHPTLWEPLVPNPPYSDYTSGHAAGTSPFAEVVRQTLGDDVTLVLKAAGTERTYNTLTALEHDAFHARIWGGLHFRDAMEDGYHMGHVTADRVMRALR